MTEDKRWRTTREVIEDHLCRRFDGDLDGDIAHNYDPRVVLLSAEGVNRGYDGVRTLAGVLRRYVGDGSFTYRQLLADGEIAMLNWTADRGQQSVIHDGVDTFVVRGGLIVAQTIHYSSS